MNDLNIPLVSVAIITYNQKQFLKECIESVLFQDYQNIEIIIADDGSTDGTQDMLKDYSNQYPNLFTLKLSNINCGITNNSNIAHFACKGKYISWMGGDDLMLPYKLSKQVAFMESHQKCSICYHNLEVFDSSTGKPLYFFNTSRNSKQGNIKTLIKFGTINGACSTMVRTDQTPILGFDQLLPVASDWLFWIETLANGGEIHYLNEVLGKYRRHASNVTKKQITNSISQNELDHLLTCSILLSRYPEYNKQVFKRMSVILRSYRFLKKDKYESFLSASLNCHFNWKSLALLILHFASFKILKNL